MKKTVLALLALSAQLSAVPSTVFWTNCTTAVQEYGTAQICLIDYFSVFNRRGHGSSLPTDFGFTVGLLDWKNIHGEAGIDYLGGTDDPLFFNAKLGVEQDKLFKGAPSFSVGVFNWGTRYRTHERTNQNIVDFIVGRTLSSGHALYFGAFHGSRTIGKNRLGLMAAVQLNFKKTKDCHDKEFYRWQLSADAATGKNTIGGAGVSMAYYFTPDISLETGPVWFNDASINGKWKWSVQAYWDVPLWKKEENGNGNGNGKKENKKKENGNLKKENGKEEKNKDSESRRAIGTSREVRCSRSQR